LASITIFLSLLRLEVRMNQAERKFALSIFVKVGTALSADWMRPLALKQA
jgi:hypothetical protein